MSDKIKLGKKPSKDGMIDSGNAMEYPSMYVYDTELPLEKDDVGKTFDAKIKLKFTGINISNNERGERFNYDFEITEIEFVENPKKKGKE